MTRETILLRLRALLDEAPPLPSAVPAFPMSGDPAAAFRREAERVTTRVIEGRSLEAALSLVLEETKQTRLHWQGVDMLTRHGIAYAPVELPSSPTLLVSKHPQGQVVFPLELETEPYSRSAVAEVQVSVGSAVYGVAETGTIVETVESGWGRVLPILAPCHVTLLSRSRLLENHAELFRTLDLNSGGSARLLMTGPSRTADIEKTLILGVHGPGRLFVVLLP